MQYSLDDVTRIVQFGLEHDMRSTCLVSFHSSQMGVAGPPLYIYILRENGGILDFLSTHFPLEKTEMANGWTTLTILET
jgi:hypothetical protein